LDTIPLILKSEAKQIARKELHRRYNTPNLYNLGRTALVFFQGQYQQDSVKEIRLTYRINLQSGDDPWSVFVDVKNSDVIGFRKYSTEVSNCQYAKGVEKPQNINLMYYNNLPHFNTNPKTITTEYCDFGGTSCEKYHLKTNVGNHLLQVYYRDNQVTDVATNYNIDMEWAPSNHHISPVVNFTVQPTSGSSFADGTVKIDIAGDSGATYNGDLTGVSGSTHTNLGVGFKRLFIDKSTNGCNYVEHLAIGTVNGPTVTSNVIHTDCHTLGDIELNITPSPSSSSIDIEWRGPISSTSPQTPFNINNPVRLSDLVNPGSIVYLPAGNYAIIVREFGGTDTHRTAINVRIEAPSASCNQELKTAQTAYWCMEQAHDFFSTNTPIYLNASNTTTVNVNNVAVGLVSQNINNFTGEPHSLEVVIRPQTEPFPSTQAGTVTDIFDKSKIKITMGEGNASLDDSWVSLDISAHEYTHAVNFNNVNLGAGIVGTTDDESPMLMEGFSDIFGVLIEATIKPIDWEVGENVVTPSEQNIRSLINPKSPGVSGKKKPKVYKGEYWCSTSNNICNDNIKHHNSTVLSHWFYLLSVGSGGTKTVDDCPSPTNCPNSNAPNKGENYNLTGIGVDKAAQIAYVTFVDKSRLSSTSNFQNACDQSLLVAEQMYGACSFEYIETANAWFAVGMVKSDITCEGYLGATVQLEYEEDCDETNGELELEVTILSGAPPFDYELLDGTTGTINDLNTPTTIAIPYLQFVDEYEVTITDTNGDESIITAPYNCFCSLDLDCAQIVNPCLPVPGTDQELMSVTVDVSGLPFSDAYTISTSNGSNLVFNDGGFIHIDILIDPATNPSGEVTLSIIDEHGCSTAELTTDCGGCMPTSSEGNWGTGSSDGLPPVFTNQNQSTLNACVGEEICIDYYIDDINYPISIISDNDSFVQTAISNGPNAEGRLCWTPTLEDVGTVDVTLTAIEYSNTALYATHTYSVTVECGNQCPACPSCFQLYGFEVTDVTLDCNGNVVEAGSIFIDSYPEDCPITVSHNGIIANPVTGLTEGTYSNIEITKDNGETLMAIPITVESQQMSGEEIITEVSTNRSYFNNSTDYCTGSIQLAAFSENGSGEYGYQWADCSNCNTTNRSKLCGGTYTVTITDLVTGCLKTQDIVVPLKVGIRYIDQALDYFGIYSTVFDANVTISYTVNTDVPITLSIYDLNGSPITTIKENEWSRRGSHKIRLDTDYLYQGTYLFIIKTPYEMKTVLGFKQ
ncbi:MAG: M4 family metallopeptidase, partial [Chitinophagales bacterium]